jgi:hypothetical protein
MIKLRKIHFKDETIFLFLGAIIVAVAIFGVADYFYKQSSEEEVVEVFDEYLPAKCENGNWIEFPDPAEKEKIQEFKGQEKLKYDEAKEFFSGEDGTRVFLTDERYSLFFFIDRKIEIEGYQLKDGAVYIKKAKCVGIEADRDVLSKRRNLMTYIRDNINDLVPEKAPNNDWQVETFYFATDTDVYVQYESEGSFMEEAPYDSRLWLVRVTNQNQVVPTIETLAYIIEDAEDSARNVVKEGVDLYKEMANMIIYEFDEEFNQWVLQ